MLTVTLPRRLLSHRLDRFIFGGTGDFVRFLFPQSDCGIVPLRTLGTSLVPPRVEVLDDVARATDETPERPDKDLGQGTSGADYAGYQGGAIAEHERHGERWVCERLFEEAAVG